MLLTNINRKVIALATAVVVWIFVNQSITETKTIPNVPIKILNLPEDKTIPGLLPNGYISQRVTLTVSGSKDVIQELEPGDLEVHLDAAIVDDNDLVVLITKKNIVSLNPSIDLRHYITNISHPEFVLKLSKLVTEKIPIFIKTPTGDAPKGYEYLDIWPETLMQILSGPEEEIEALKSKGLKLTLDLNLITTEELDALKQSTKHGHNDEISYFVPERLKKIPIPFRDHAAQEINDPEAQNLRIDFLKKKLNPLGKEIPIAVYYPLKTLHNVNPSTQKLKNSSEIPFMDGISLFSPPLYVKDVSRLFLDIIRDHLEIVITAAPKNERETLQWSLEVINASDLEDTYVAYVIANQKKNWSETTNPKNREEVLRKRFKDYLQKLVLYRANGEKLNLVNTVINSEIEVSSH